jgi:putative membrane protein
MNMGFRHFDNPPFGPDGNLWWQHGLFLLLAVAALSAGAVLIARAWLNRPARPAPQGHNAAVAELDVRYARGEIERDDYMQRRADLLGNVLPSTAAARPGPADPGTAVAQP